MSFAYRATAWQRIGLKVKSMKTTNLWTTTTVKKNGHLNQSVAATVPSSFRRSQSHPSPTDNQVCLFEVWGLCFRDTQCPSPRRERTCLSTWLVRSRRGSLVFSVGLSAWAGVLPPSRSSSRGSWGGGLFYFRSSCLENKWAVYSEFVTSMYIVHIWCRRSVVV